MRHPLGIRLFVSATFVSFVACSGSTSTTCDNASPCGGNIVGTWKVLSECYTSTAIMPDESCPAETIAVNSENDTGTFVFNADGTYQTSLDVSASETVTAPLSCLTLSGVTTCDQFAMSYSASLQPADGGPSPIAGTCTTSGSNCVCSVTVALNGLAIAGTYTVSGTSFTTMPTGSSGTGGGQFCVQGNTLKLIGMTMAGAGTPQIPVGVVTAARQ